MIIHLLFSNDLLTSHFSRKRECWTYEHQLKCASLFSICYYLFQRFLSHSFTKQFPEQLYINKIILFGLCHSGPLTTKCWSSILKLNIENKVNNFTKLGRCSKDKFLKRSTVILIIRKIFICYNFYFEEAFFLVWVVDEKATVILGMKHICQW